MGMVAKRALAAAKKVGQTAVSTARRAAGVPAASGTPKAAKKGPTKKAPAKKTATQAAKKVAKATPTAKPATTKKAATKAAAKSTAKKAPAKKAPAKKTATKVAGKQATPVAAGAQRTAKKSSASKQAQKKAGSVKKTAKAAPAAKQTAAKKAPAKKAAAAAKAPAPAKKAPAKSAVQKRASSASGAASAPLAVREDESPWTAKELRGVRAELEADIAQLREELIVAEEELNDLLRDSGDGAGDDQADAGAKTFEREQEIALADNSREMLRQNEHALERLDNGTYGICESCGQPIGKLRLQAAPRATLCMPCKQKEERR
jgi:RNA polymerase-binding protein DksA